jgi:hypothetical protein
MYAQLTLCLFVAVAPAQHRMTLLDRANENGLVGMIGLGLMAIAIIIGLYWFICLCTARRPGAMLPIIATVLGVVGYVGFEKELIATNLSMRDAQTVRDDCLRLMEEVSTKSENSSEPAPLQLASSELPPSFAKLGAKSATVTSENVEILLFSDLERGARGFLYAPQETQGVQAWQELRPTWYRDFYAFQKWPASP